MSRNLFRLGSLLLLAIAATPLEAQTGTITGRVNDARTLAPIPSVQVYVAGLDRGTLSDGNGRFLLVDVPSGTHTVTAERIGYEVLSRDVAVLPGETIVQDFALSESALQLDEIVVTGTAGGTQRRAIGNVVSDIDADEMSELTGAITVEQMLGQNAAGVISGSPGSTVGGDGGAITIRGSSSPGLSNSPLVYVDGMRMYSDRVNANREKATSRLNDINPADIERIEIIKGPAASTLYGTEASNGVINIITKRGVTGEPSFDASVELGGMWLSDPAEKVGDHWGINPTTGEAIRDNLVLREEERFGQPMFQTGPLQKYDLAVRGGTDAIRYFGSIGRTSREGIVRWNWEENMSARVNLGISASESVNFDLNASMVDGSFRDDGEVWGELWAGNPAKSAEAGGREDPRRGFWRYPPNALRDYREQIRGVNRTTASLQMNFSPRTWLDNRFVVGVDITHAEDSDFTQQDVEFQWFGNSSREGAKEVSRRETRFTTFDYGGTARIRVSDDRLGGATSWGLQFTRREGHNTNSEGEGFATPALSTVSAASITSAGESFSANATVGTYLQQQLDWEQRLFVTGAVRFDDNSAFGSNFDAAVYPKLSATWVMHEESFWDVGFLEQFRLRGAWGRAGLQPDAFAATTLYQVEAGPGDAPILTPSASGNPDVAPETSGELELGFDAALFNERVNFDFTRYWKSTSDALVRRPLAESMGFATSQWANIGGTENWGMEAGVDVRVLTENPVVWSLSGSFSTMHNRITSLAEDGDPTVDQIDVGRGRAHVEGFPLGSIIARRVVSAEFESGSSGATTNHMCDGGSGLHGREIGGSPVPCDEAPYLYWGRPGEPTWSATAASTLNLFSNWTLYTQVDARGGHYMYQDGIAARHTSFSNSQCVNLQDDALCSATIAVDRTSTGIYKGDFARLRELSLRYALPTGMAETLRLERASISLAWRNVGLLWFPGKWADRLGDFKYRMRVPDPEMSQQNEQFGGIANRAVPPTSSLSATFRVSF